MIALGPVSFAFPWALAGLLALPVIWWLLRLTPPLPTIIAFPPVRLLMGLGAREESAAKTPLAANCQKLTRLNRKRSRRGRKGYQQTMARRLPSPESVSAMLKSGSS